MPEQSWYQSQAPCYYRLPDDGAKFKCYSCGEPKTHNEMLKVFTPDGKPRQAICDQCVDEDWLNHAKELPYGE